MANDHKSENTLRMLMVEEIRDIYDAERQLVKALPKMAEAATSIELRTLIETHLEETRGHVGRLERAFEMIGERPQPKRCAGIAGIVEEGSDLLDEDFEGAVMDAGIIAGAQRAEHYEIAAYGALVAWAKLLGEEDMATLLHETLQEEKGANEKLTALASSTINEEAAADDAEADMDDVEIDEDSGEASNVAAPRRPAERPVAKRR